MPSVIQKKSCGSVKTFWLDKALLDVKLKQAMKEMLIEKRDIDCINIRVRYERGVGLVGTFHAVFLRGCSAVFHIATCDTKPRRIGRMALSA